LGLGVAVVALAGGVMFCADAFDEPSDVVIRHDDETEETVPPGDDDTADELPTARVDWTYTDGDSAKPSFYAVKSGTGPWRHPEPDGDLIQFEVHDEQGRYSLALVCEAEDDKGKTNIHTVMLEGTVRELDDPRITCPVPAAQQRTVQLAGAVRNTGGQDVAIAIGTRRFQVENEKRAEGLLFSAEAPQGRNAVLAIQGTGEKARIAAARNVRLDGATANVEIDMNDAEQTVPTNIPVAGDGYSYLAGGQAFLWFDGRTRMSVGPVAKELVDDEVTLGTRTTEKAVDVLDLHLDFRNKMPFWGIEPSPVAHVRFMRSASTPIELVLPELGFTEESVVRLGDETIDVAWKMTNWSAFGYTSDDDFALFMPTAYVARFSQEDTARRHLDLVVTPMRARGPNPAYTFENPVDTAGFEDRWLFRPADDMTVRVGNLTAYANGERAVPSDAIAAYLDSGAASGPGGYLHTRSLTTVVAGDGTEVIDDSLDLSEYFEQQCVEVATCVEQVAQDATHVQDCADLELYRRCTDFPTETDAAQFVDDLQREIIRWYLFDEERRENGPSMQEILGRISAKKVRMIDEDEPGIEYYPYDPRVFQVFYHPDPVDEGSPVLWYGAYLRGNLISIYPVNYYRLDR
jgi:hypothetical protein